MAGRRMVIISIDDLARMFRDYVGLVGFPVDAKPVKLMMNSKERKLGLVVESDEFTGPQAPEEVKFDLRRFYSVGGGVS